MANSLVQIPASKDTLFMRGFSYRQDIENIRDFFARECGRNTVEFFKEDGKDQLYVALRFESKSIAADALHRFNDADVLGDRISMSWYKDLRRARTYDRFGQRPMFRNNYGVDDQYDYRERNQYAARPTYPSSKPRYPQVASRPRRYTRSSSRSRSRSMSRTLSPSRSRSRSSSRSYESREHRKKRQRSVSDSGRKHKTSTGKNKSSKVHSTTPDHDSSQSDDSLPPVKSTGLKKASEAGEHTSPVRKTKSAAKTKEKVVEAEPASADPGHGSDMNELTIEASPVQQQTSTGKTSATRSGVRSAVQKKLSSKQSTEQATDPVEVGSLEVANSSAKKSETIKESAKTKKVKEEKRVFEEQISDDLEDDENEVVVEKPTLLGRKVKEPEDSFPQRTTRQTKIVRDMAQPLNDVNSLVDQGYDADEPPREIRPLRKRKPVPQMVGEEFDRQFDEFNFEGDEEMMDGKRRFLNDPMLDGRQPRAGYDDMRIGAQVASGRRRSNYENSASFGGRGDVGRGAMGLSQEKMMLIKEKKEEIEKAYRQDCETFATVTKLLISKDADLEDRIQSSLRENLKEIGQRCIQELRDFVDRLKSEDDI